MRSSKNSQVSVVAPPAEDCGLVELCRYNTLVIEQVMALVEAHQAAAAPHYAVIAGPHLRHLIEHYEALLFRNDPARVDYDQRPRDRQVEHDPALAHERLRAIRAAIAALARTEPADALQVSGLAGGQGELTYTVHSSLARELVFLASHAVHHLAVIKPYCDAYGLPHDAHLGLAPATIAHQLSQGESSDV